MTKYYNIQALRGIAALLVVFSHLLIIEKKYGGSETILPEVFRFGVSGVDLFFVISGFIMVTVTKNKFQSVKESSNFILHRITRIYPPYWFYSFLVLIVFLVHPEWVNSAQGNKVDILYSFLLFPSDTLPLLNVGWTLIHEIYFYIVFTIFLLLLSEKYLIHALLLWGIAIALFNLYSEATEPLVLLVTSPLTYEFIAGCFLAIFYRHDKAKISNILLILIIGVTIILSSYFFMRHFNYYHLTPESWSRALILGTPALIVTYCVLVAGKNKFIFSQWLIKIGDASYSIYLTHVLTFSALGRLWSLFPIDSFLDNLIILPVFVFLACVVGILSYRFIEKPVLKLSRKYFN